MKAVRFARFGPPSEVLRLEELPIPEPAPGEVRLRLTHRPINPSDLLTVAGVYPIRPALPGSPGLEGVGRVDAVGQGVDIPLGQRMITLAAVPGTWAEAVLVSADRLLSIPETMADQTAAQFLVNPMTAWALLDDLALSSGDWLLQTAAGSTLGRLLIELTRSRGVRTINVVRRREQIPELLELGADQVLATEDGPLVDQVLGLTAGQGVLSAIDAVGGALGAQVAACLAPGGRMLVMGLLEAEPTLPMTTADILFKEATIRGFWLARWFARQAPERVGQAIGEVMHLLVSGVLHPAVEAEYELADFREAVVHTARSGRRGKVLLTG